METARASREQQHATAAKALPQPAARPAHASVAPSPAVESRRSAPPPVRLSDAPPPATGSARQPAAVSQLLVSPGAGDALSTPVRSALEGSLGVSFESVRVHTDARSSSVVDHIGARAFTYGRHVFLGSRESTADLSLMGHEATHVVQQQRGGRAVQMWGASSGTGALEAEAHSASRAVVNGQPFQVTNRTSEPRVQYDWLPGFVRSGLNAALNFVRERANRIPGYELLTFILGRDPITDRNVDRNATNLIRAITSLLPGGDAMFENLQRARVIERVSEWFTTEIRVLNLTWTLIRNLFQRAWDTLSALDFASPMRAFERVRAIFAPHLERLLNFVSNAGRKLFEFIFEGAMALGGSAAQRILGVFRRIGATFSAIVNDPIGFLGNLINAVRGGFNQFRANILDHLRTGLFEWLTGAMAGALRLPQRFDAMGIISLVLQILGATYDNLRQRLVGLIGEPAVRYIETAFEFLRTIVTRGLAAAWDKILEFASGLVDTVIGGIRDWVARSVVGAAITQLATMFNPVGALIQAVIGIYNTVMFFIERAQQIGMLLDAIFDSISNIASGNISAAITYVERTMARAIPVILGFLGRLINLGNVTTYVRNIIERIRTVITSAIDRVANFIVTRVRGLLMSRQRTQQQPATTASGTQGRLALPEPVSFTVEGESHRVWVEMVNGRPTPMVASTPMTVIAYVTALETRVNNLPSTDPLKAGLLADIGPLRTDAGALTGAWAAAMTPTGPRSGTAVDYQRFVTRIRHLLELVAHGAHTGSASDPIPIIWYKGGYRPILLNTPQGSRAFYPNRKAWLRLGGRFARHTVGGGFELGVDARFFPSVGKRIQRTNGEARKLGFADTFIEILEQFGYNWNAGGRKNPDHVQDLALGGVDDFMNLWPLDAAANLAGNAVYRQYVWVQEPAGLRIAMVDDLMDKWFVIRRIM